MLTQIPAISSLPLLIDVSGYFMERERGLDPAQAGRANDV
jgi:hypothetical protein